VKNKKNKLQWSLCRASQSDQNQQQKQCICRAFIEAHGKGAIYCRAFPVQAHGKEGSLPCVFFASARQRTLFAVRFFHRRTANSPLCRAFFSQAHDKQPSLLCVFSRRRTAKRALCRAFFSRAHGKEGCMPFGSGAVSCFYLPCVAKKRTAKNIYRALSDVAHGKDALPCKMLLCALCRAPRRKTHRKGFAVRFWSFAKPRFPVVLLFKFELSFPSSICPETCHRSGLCLRFSDMVHARIKTYPCH
jgi:hypothetical protein